jgi:hypothetical protein
LKHVTSWFQCFTSVYPLKSEVKCCKFLKQSLYRSLVWHLWCMHIDCHSAQSRQLRSCPRKRRYSLKSVSLWAPPWLKA